jgi:hypothetical protein
MPCPPHSPWLYLPNNIWEWLKIMKLLTVQLPPFSRHIITLRSKYPPHTGRAHLATVTLNANFRYILTVDYLKIDKIN